jgi:hypothetical protein
LLEASVIHADLASASALATSDEHRAARAVEIELVEIERLLYPHPARQSTTIKPRARAP